MRGNIPPRSLLAILAFTFPAAASPLPAEPLPGTAELDWEGEEFSERILDGAHAFIERKIGDAAKRTIPLPRDAGERKKFVEASRAALKKKLGVVDGRLAPRMEFFSDSPVSFDGRPPSALVSTGPGFEVHAVRWDVLPGFSAEGLLVSPTSEDPLATSPPAMILLPDAGETPEDLLALNANLPGNRQMALRFAAAGFRILIPCPLDRSPYGGPGGDDEGILRSKQTRREWIWRQGFQMGRHPLGYEIQAALAGVDWLLDGQIADSITVAGHGEGGRAALYAAAIDPRIDHAFVSGAFGPRAAAWSEPIDRNVFDLLPDHPDASVAALVSPRPLLVEHTASGEFESEKGSFSPVPAEEAGREFERIADVLGSFGTPPGFLFHPARSGSRADFPAVAAFLQTIGIEREISRVPPVALLFDERENFDPSARSDRVLAGMEAHVQRLVDASPETRREYYFHRAEPRLLPGRWSTEKDHPTLDPDGFIEASEEFRESFRDEVIGRFDEDRLPARPRSRKILETEEWTAWDVVLDVYPEFSAWGVLVVPKGIVEGERRPLVVCQHGRNGVPRDTVDAGKSAYNDFAARLAERGFVTFAPFHLYRGEDRYRWLDRKANLVGATLFSFLVESHEQFLPWLASLPEVDPDRIAFYGLSYGGESAMRIPSLLDGYCLSICSGDFNHWTRKVADPDFPMTFMRTIEWEMPYWNMGNTFDYGDLAGLIFPRPFFVERGHHDGVSRDESVALEYARVRRLYALFGMPGRTGIEFFPGGHSIRGEGAFDFLHRHLDWPSP